MDSEFVDKVHRTSVTATPGSPDEAERLFMSVVRQRRHRSSQIWHRRLFSCSKIKEEGLQLADDGTINIVLDNKTVG